MNGEPFDPNLAQALGELPPMFAPNPLTWWPPAIGWLVLAALLIAVCAVGLVMAYKRKAETKILNAALSALADLRDQIVAQLSQTDITSNTQNAALERCSTILRITAETYFAQPRLSSLSGTAWLKKLDRLSLTKEPILSSQSGCNILKVYEDKLLNNEELLTVIDICAAWVSTTKDNHRLIKNAKKLTAETSNAPPAIEQESQRIKERSP